MSTGAGSGNTSEQPILTGIERREALARAAIEPSAMHPYGNVYVPPLPAERWPDEVRGALGGPWGEHCAANDPTHVLAALAAAREELADAVAQQERHAQWGDDWRAFYCVGDHPKDRSGEPDADWPCPDAQQAARTLARLVALYGGDA